MTEPSGDYASRVQDYKQRLENLLVEAQGAIDRQAPDVLDKMAATARNIAQRLDDMANDARQRAEDKEATPESAGTVDRAPEPPNEPPRSSGESRTAGTEDG
jgi:phage-related minor tail protein